MLMCECSLLDEIFSHEDNEGVTRHFNPSAMLRAIIDLKVFPICQMIDLSTDLVESIESNHGVEQDRLDKILDRLDNPIVIIKFEDQTHLVIDGNHRVVKRWRLGKDDAPAFIFEPGQWEDFLVTDMDLPRGLYIPMVTS